MSIEVTDELVRRVATLSRLAISAGEAEGIKHHFEKILAFIRALQELDTKDVDPSMFAVASRDLYRDIFRRDEVRGSLPLKAVLDNAPDALPPYFRVPRILAEKGDEARAGDGPAPGGQGRGPAGEDD